MFYGSNGKRNMAGRVIPWLDSFSWGVENPNASIRIPLSVQQQGKGCYDDYRPASNMDPYLVTTILVCTALDIDLPEEVRT